MSEKASKGRFLKAEKERKRREKSNGCTLSFYNGYFGRKKLSDAKVHLAMTFSKIELDM